MTVRRIYLLTLVVMPVTAGLLTLLTGSLAPVSGATGILVAASLAAGTSPSRDPSPARDGTRRVTQWWNRRRRMGFYAAFSVLLMAVFVFARSALTDTWGSGDLLLVFLLVIPLLVIFRSPPRRRTRARHA